MLTPRIMPRRIHAVPPVRIKPFSLLNAHEEREDEEDLELENTLDMFLTKTFTKDIAACVETIIFF